MPYQRYATFASLALLLLLLGHYLLPNKFPGLLIQIGHGLAVLVTLAFLLNSWLLVRDYRNGHLFIIRNATFFVGLLTLIVVIWFLVQDLLGRQEMSISAWWMAPLLLFYYTHNLFRVRLDDVSLEVKTGLSQAVSMPLFDLTEVVVTEDLIEAKRVNGEQYSFSRQFFFTSQWQRLQERFRQLANSGQ